MSDTTILFERPSFWEGMARVLDIGNTINVYNDSTTGKEADLKAIRADWNAILSDYKKAVEEVTDEEKIETQKH